MTKSFYKWRDVVPTGLTVRDLYKTLSRHRPSTWSMFYRSVKGSPFSYNVASLIDTFQHAGDNATKRRFRMLLTRHRPFLVQPLNDPHPHKVYQKGRQIGASELSITEELWFLDTHPRTKWIHTFPREAQLTDFSTTRINEARSESPYMKHLFKPPQQALLKRIGADSFLVLRSSWESGLGEGVDADGVTLDEKDRMKDGVEGAFRQSLSSSSWGLLRELSTPTIPGAGINANFSRSDQMEWHVRCTKCSMWQTVEYPDNLIQVADYDETSKEIPEGTFAYLCRKSRCRGPLDRIHGMWVPKFPDRKQIRGYMIPQTICAWHSADHVMQERIELKYKQLWENYVLGRTSVGDTVLLTDEDFAKSIAGHQMYTHRPASGFETVSVGIDWGHLNWVTVLGQTAEGHKYLLACAHFEDSPTNELQSVHDIHAFIAPFDPDIIVADGGYGKDRNSYLLRRYPDKMWSCWYNTSEKGSRTFRPSWSEGFSKVNVDRTMTLKDTCRALKEGQIGLPAYDHEMQLFQKHFENLVPMRIEENGEIYEVIQKKGDDHFAHSCAYSLLGLEKLESAFSAFDGGGLDVPT